MRAAGSQKAIARRPSGVFLQREPHHHRRTFQAAREEVTDSDPERSWSWPQRIQTQRVFEVPDAEVDLSSPEPEPSTPVPANGGARIELERTIDQNDRWIDLVLEVADHERGLAEDIRIIAGSSDRSPGKFDTLLMLSFQVLAPSVLMKILAALSCQHQRRSVVRVELKCAPN